MKAIISKIQAASNLKLKDAEAFLDLGQPISIANKEFLAKPGRQVNQVLFLKTGIVRHFIIGKQQKEFTKNFILAPHFTVPSLSDFFLQTPSLIYCQALADTEAISWDYQDVINFSENHPRFYKFLLTAVVGAFRKKERKEIALNQLEAKARYLQFLEDFPGLINQVSHHYIASYLNIRPETLSRIRANLIS